MNLAYSETAVMRTNGTPCPAYFFVWNGTCIYDPRVSECGRFEVSPSHYGLTQIQVDHVVRINRQLGALE